MATVDDTIPLEGTSSYKFLNYAFRFHGFVPRRLRNQLQRRTRYPTRFQPWFLRLNTTSFDSIHEEDRARLSLYWKYDEALLDGGYTLERLWRCHGADVTLHDGTVLQQHPRVVHEIDAKWDRNDDNHDDALAQAEFERDCAMRELYVEDVNYVIRGGVLSDLAREYCFNFGMRPFKIQNYIKEDRFHRYVSRMTGLPYEKLWPNARFLWCECWEHDRVLLEAGYSYERLKIFHMLMFSIECHRGIFRLKPYMLANWNDHDDMAEARKAAKCHPKDYVALFVQDIENALSHPELLLAQRGSRRDLKDLPLNNDTSDYRRGEKRGSPGVAVAKSPIPPCNKQKK